MDVNEILAIARNPELITAHIESTKLKQLLAGLKQQYSQAAESASPEAQNILDIIRKRNLK